MRIKPGICSILLPVLVISLNPGCKEPGWESINIQIPSLFAEVWGIRDLSLVDDFTGYALLGGVEILKTSDGGDTWTRQYSEIGNTLHGIHFTDSLRGWAAGSDIITCTEDGGITWTDQLSGVPISLASLFCLDDSTLWAVGSTRRSDECIIYHTTDGGETWIIQETGINTHLFSAFFTDPDTGTVVGGWCNNCTGGPYFGGYILRTTNGGARWDIQLLDTSLIGFYGVHFTDSRTGIVTGAEGTILRTTDGGTSWSRQQVGTTADLRDVCFAGTDTGYVVGGGSVRPFQNGIILRTTDGGKTWERQETPVTHILLSVDFFSSGKGIAAGYLSFFKTTSGGEPVSGWKRNLRK